MPKSAFRLSSLGVSLAPAGVLVVLVLGIGAVQPSFLSLYSLSVLAAECVPILLLSLAQTAVILLGAIDLSIAAVASLASVLVALLLPGYGVAGLAAVLLLSTLVGAGQGYVQFKAQIPSFVVTLAGMGLWSGVALSIAHTTVPVSRNYDLVGWIEGTLVGLPVSFLVSIAAGLMLWLSFRWSRMGRYVRAIGLGESAAILSGVPVGGIKIMVFALSGLLAGLTGIASVARTYSGNPSAATSLLLPSIAAVVVGGTTITGGLGGFVQTIIGVLVITVLRVGIAVAGVDPGYEPLCYGLVIIGAVALTTDRIRLAVVK
ncbi:ABC transporter permease [Mesorhizobium sp. B3-1-6]|uniref:ABC transporter permease n=1 Tax=Mesorhizobium sp. B3-1-6 TaxID=2589895 RepID=UPI001128801F|nr:ABC transporter permease [Mesorhizobium sp. B3-1-6]TPI41348.1 ABC transporter permease [Mesorhizobium sp. B3-1-6]